MQRKKFGNIFFPIKENSLPTFKIKGKFQRCCKETHHYVSPKLKVKYCHFKMLYVFLPKSLLARTLNLKIENHSFLNYVFTYDDFNSHGCPPFSLMPPSIHPSIHPFLRV